MVSKASFKRLKLFSFKLNALLEVTQAINANPSIQELLDKYTKILRDDLNIGRVLIYKKNGSWDKLLSSGFSSTEDISIDVQNDLIQYKEITFVSSNENEQLDKFDIIIPVITQETALAFVLIGDIDEEAEGVSPTIKHLNFIQTISNVIMVAIENIRLFNESLRQEAMKKELELAKRMQFMLIPNKDKLPKNENVKVTAFYHPHYDVGGDYYDCLMLNDHEIGLCIADVSGKGISAAILMSNFQANLRALFTIEISLQSLVHKLNERVMSSANGEKFITLFIGKYNFRTRQLEYINAGHNPPILYEKEKKKISLLRSGCVGVGMLEEIPVIKEGVCRITEPSKLFTYTDGLVELVDDNGVEFSTESVEQHLSNDRSIAENIAEIIEKQKILAGSKAIFDDISIMGIEFTPNQG